MPRSIPRPVSVAALPGDRLHGARRRAVVAAGLGMATVLPVSGQVAPVATRPREMELVSEAWHDLTRKDGSGLYFDLIRMVYTRLGIQARIRIVPYARSVQMVKEKRADAWVASFLKEKDFPIYPRWHFDRNAQMVVYRKAQPADFRGAPSLRNQRVAWLRDFGLDRYIRESMKITEVDAIANGLQMLAHGRIDYFVGARSDLEDAIRKDRIEMAPFEMKFMMYLGLFLAFADTPRGALLRDLWDQEMETLHKAPEFRAIYQKYGYEYPFS